jgi:hypothetical protein
MKFMILSFLIIPSALNACPGHSPCIEVLRDHEEKFRRREKMEMIIESREVDILEFAKNYIGIPYLYGGETTNGIDCSAFIQHIHQEFGISLPRTSRQQFAFYALEEVSVNEIAPQDLLFFRGEDSNEIDHVAMYVSEGKMIHSSRKEKGVQITDFKFSPFWSSRFIAAKRIKKEYL